MKVAIVFLDARGAVISSDFHNLPFGHANEQALKDACIVLAGKTDLSRKELDRVRSIAVYVYVTEQGFSFERRGK